MAWIVKPEDRDLPESIGRDVHPANRYDFTLEEIYTHISNDCTEFEMTKTAAGSLMLVDEDGIAKGLPLNEVATRIHWRNERIYGNALICQVHEVQ